MAKLLLRSLMLPNCNSDQRFAVKFALTLGFDYFGLVLEFKVLQDSCNFD